MPQGSQHGLSLATVFLVTHYTQMRVFERLQRFRRAIGGAVVYYKHFNRSRKCELKKMSYHLNRRLYFIINGNDNC